MAPVTATMDSPLAADFQYYLDHQNELVARYNGRVIVICAGEVLGDYDNVAAAIAETTKSHPLGTFLVQKVEPGSGSYTQTFHSRVAFA